MYGTCRRKLDFFPQTCRIGYPCIAVQQDVSTCKHPAECSSGTLDKGNVSSVHTYIGMVVRSFYSVVCQGVHVAKLFLTILSNNQSA